MREPKRPSDRLTVRPPLETRRRRPTPGEYAELKGQLAQYTKEYGRDLLKAEVNRKPVSKPRGRPPVWDRWRLFTLWLIIHAFARRYKLEIDSVCKNLEAAGGILEDDPDGNPRKIATTSGNIRRLFYTAEQELTKWVPPLQHDSEHSALIDNISLKERIYDYVDLLSRYESFYLTGLRVAAEIVHYEFSKDGVCDCYPSLAPPLHPPEMAGVNLRNLQVIDFFPGLTHKRRGRDRTR